MKVSKRLRTALVENGAVLCPEHRRLLARATPEGLELWCRTGGHTVLLPWESCKIFLKGAFPGSDFMLQ